MLSMNDEQYKGPTIQSKEQMVHHYYYHHHSVMNDEREMCEISIHMDKYSHLYTLIDVRFYVFMQLLVIHALIYAFIDYLGNVYALSLIHI